MFKKIIFVFLFFAFYILQSTLCTKTVFAHLIGQPPYFKINGKYVLLYPVPVSSTENFTLPQDSAPENYLINTPIQLELDTKFLPAPPEVIQKTQFIWDFGDGEFGYGLKNTHTYKKQGSYFLTIKADDKTTPQPQILEFTLINLLPDKNYQLPQAIIEVDSKQSQDPLTDIIKVSFDKQISFNGSRSKEGSAKIISYFWDFGDKTSSPQSVVTHNYPLDQSQFFPLLRIKDSNGFISDGFVEIQNSLLDKNTTPLKQVNQNPPPTSNQLPYVLAGLLLIVIFVTIYTRSKKR